MKITHVRLEIWIDTKKGNQFDDCNKAEDLLKDVKKYIQDRGYNVPEEFCGLNPSLFISIK